LVDEHQPVGVVGVAGDAELAGVMCPVVPGIDEMGSAGREASRRATSNGHWDPGHPNAISVDHAKPSTNGRHSSASVPTAPTD